MSIQWSLYNHLKVASVRTSQPSFHLLCTMNLRSYLLNYLFIKEISIINEFLKHKNVQNGIIYHCYNAQTTCLMLKTLNENNVRVSIQTVDKNNKTIASQDHGKVGIIINTSCHGWISVFDSVKAKTFRNPFVWLVITENITETRKLLPRYNIELDSDVTIISKHKNVDTFYEVYRTGFGKNGQFIVREFGFWNDSEIQNRRDLQGLVLRTPIVILLNQRVVNKTFISYLDGEQPDLIKVDPVNKFKAYAVLKYFHDMFNISYEFRRTKSWGYGSNGTFDGLVGVLQRGEGDIGGSPVFIRADRMYAVDYVTEAWHTKPYFIFRHPKHMGGFHTIYTRPLEDNVWWCIISLMVLSTVVLGLLLHLKIPRSPELSEDDHDTSLSFACLFIWSAICQQGTTIRRSTVSMKMVMLTTFLFGVTLYQFYNAMVVSTLLQEQPKNIKTLKDLLKSNLKAGVEDILYNKDYFKRTTDPVAREIYQKKVVHTNPPQYFSTEQGLAMVKKGGFAFHVDSAVAYRIMRHTFSEKELCELQEVTVFAPSLALVVAKNSPYKEIIAYGMRKLKESGILSHLSSLWDASRPPCVRTPDASVISVSILEFSTALAVLAFGYGSALIVLAAELLAARLGRRHVIEFTH